MGSILLVESDPQPAHSWAKDLAAAGHTIQIASAAEALLLLRDGGIEVVVIDCPTHCNGVVELARSIDILPDAPPLVLVSASPAAPEISARIGAAAFLPESCEPAELVAVLARLLGELRPVRAVDDDEPTNRTHYS